MISATLPRPHQPGEGYPQGALPLIVPRIAPRLPRTTESDWGVFPVGGKESPPVYETRFVTQYPTPDVSLVGAHVAHALQASGHAPSTTSVQLQEEDNTAVVTICYLTDTSSESDSIIAAWRGINHRIQVERNHKLDPTKFRKIALAGRENRQLREHLTREIERLCSIGIGSKGILDYLQESEAVIVELKEFVQSMRAPV